MSYDLNKQFASAERIAEEWKVAASTVRNFMKANAIEPALVVPFGANTASYYVKDAAQKHRQLFDDWLARNKAAVATTGTNNTAKFRANVQGLSVQIDALSKQVDELGVKLDKLINELGVK